MKTNKFNLFFFLIFPFFLYGEEYSVVENFLAKTGDQNTNKVRKVSVLQDDKIIIDVDFVTKSEEEFVLQIKSKKEIEIFKSYKHSQSGRYYIRFSMKNGEFKWVEIQMGKKAKFAEGESLNYLKSRLNSEAKLLKLLKRK